MSEHGYATIVAGLSAMVIVLAGCDPNTGPSESELPALGVAAFSQSVETSATGSGHFVQANGELRKFTFSAVKRTDGGVSGQYQLVAGNGDLVAHGSVDCLTVIGNEAWIGGPLERNNVGAPFDSGWFRVADNGNGGSGTADGISLLVVAVDPTGTAAQAFCADTPAGPPLVDVVAGDISVR